MKCCDGDRMTPFCPQCGKALREAHPLDGLLRQVRANQKAQETTARTVARHSNPEIGARGQAKYLKSALKWKAWGDALEALIHPLEQAPCPDSSAR